MLLMKELLFEQLAKAQNSAIFIDDGIEISFDFEQFKKAFLLIGFDECSSPFESKEL